MLNKVRTLALILALGCAGPVLAQADPTPHQIYEAAKAGHLDQAQQMVNQALRDHPQSAKAHYVAAEIYAREGQFAQARQELNTAESLEPGLPFAPANSVRELQRELSQGQSMRMAPGFSQSAGAVRPAFPWGWVFVLVAAIAVIWAVMRRRAAAAVYSPYATGMPAAAAGPVYGPGYGPGYAGGPGIGSGIAGGLASGLAVGAGVVAGEELARHFLDGDRREGNVYPVGEPSQTAQNTDMGGNDFGLSDGGSWDDGSSGGDLGGGDSWT
ncbi:MAG TPA: tetratricopeptide repeat protein [Steroidobacteraceae bacterium]|nr:tetratricopeptide repeat protein [Steroidobacteraceae bacterium]